MAAQFSDDAFNKDLQGGNAGTLVGNWFEERVLRESTGQGRCLPQRHVPRSGLLKDFTKVPVNPRKGDNTFERVYGPKAGTKFDASSKVIGDHEAHGSISHIGPKASLLTAAHAEVAEAEVKQQEAAIEELRNVRCFDTTTGLTHARPDVTLAEKASKTRKEYYKEIMHGPAPDRSQALNNPGLEVPTHTHYFNTELVTHARMSLADPNMRSDLKASPAGGLAAFGKNSMFTMPMSHFQEGLNKDQALEEMFTGLQETRPLRHLQGTVPHAGLFAAVPSLPALKATILDQIAEVWGALGMVALRQRLSDRGDNEGFVRCEEVISVLRGDLSLSADAVSDKALQVYLGQLATMDKNKVRVAAVLSSLRPGLSQMDKGRVIEGFKQLKPVDGQAFLGEWLQHLGDDAELRKAVTVAFGAEEETQVIDIRITEYAFMELLSDLAVFMDLGRLLA